MKQQQTYSEEMQFCLRLISFEVGFYVRTASYLYRTGPLFYHSRFCHRCLSRFAHSIRWSVWLSINMVHKGTCGGDKIEKSKEKFWCTSDSVAPLLLCGFSQLNIFASHLLLYGGWYSCVSWFCWRTGERARARICLHSPARLLSCFVCSHTMSASQT